jgi:cobalt-zinc-cadmium resistance protein CzcA
MRRSENGAQKQMIRKVVDFALNHRLFVLAFAALLVGVGIVAFHNLPIDAYPK